VLPTVKSRIANRAIDNAGVQVLIIGAREEDGPTIDQAVVQLREEARKLGLGNVLDNLEAEQSVELLLRVWVDKAKEAFALPKASFQLSRTRRTRLEAGGWEAFGYEDLSDMSMAAAEIETPSPFGQMRPRHCDNGWAGKPPEAELLEHGRIGQTVPKSIDELPRPDDLFSHRCASPAGEPASRSGIGAQSA
jgi:hypothetical protein